MIDNLSILISLLAVGFVVFKAVVLDRTLPWFGPKPVPSAVRKPF